MCKLAKGSLFKPCSEEMALDRVKLVENMKSARSNSYTDILIFKG